MSTRQHLGQLHSPDYATRRDDPLAGCILWLPKKDEMNPYLALAPDIAEGCFNHPVVVLCVNRENRNATVLIVSTLYPYPSPPPPISFANSRSSLHSMAEI